MEKRGQIFSSDFVIGFIIFLFTISLFYSYITSVQAKKFQDIDLKFQSDFVFESIVNGLDKYMRNHPNNNDIDFLGNNSYRINITKLKNFKDLSYNDKKTILIEYLQDTPNFKNMDFCMYFADSLGSLKMIDSSLYSIGNNSIVLGKNSLLTQVYCNAENINTLKPSCEKPYTNSFKVSRPVIWDTDTKDDIVLMNVLICGEQIG